MQFDCAVSIIADAEAVDPWAGFVASSEGAVVTVEEADMLSMSPLWAGGVAATGSVGRREKIGSPGSTPGVDRCCAPLLSMATASELTGGAVIVGSIPPVEEAPEAAAALPIQATPLGQVTKPPGAALEVWRLNVVKPITAVFCAVFIRTEDCGRSEAGPDACVVWFHPSSEPCIGTLSAGRAVGTITCQ